MIARSPAKAEKAILVLIDDASKDIEQVLASRRRLPSAPALRPTNTCASSRKSTGCPKMFFSGNLTN